MVAYPVECPSPQSPGALSPTGTFRGPVTSEPRVLSRTESAISILTSPPQFLFLPRLKHNIVFLQFAFLLLSFFARTSNMHGIDKIIPQLSATMKGFTIYPESVVSFKNRERGPQVIFCMLNKQLLIITSTSIQPMFSVP